jgi:prepilin-type N-terminal cleavage/methylation domain-containing protein
MQINKKGFTIVELLVVIVVIAILATISVTAYNGIQNRANNTAIQSDVKNFSTVI